ncbi:MAG: fibronectin type III domain-containing protein [Desulfotomaculaceae bacterium]|nr:fibronectin type III domain-containing protein [Desulfotomaculaceae bacterium]
MKDSLIRPGPGEFFTGQKMDGLLNFYGVVKDNAAAVVEGAVVVVCACFEDGAERLLGATFTDRQGAYLICIPELPDDYRLLSFKVRAGKAYTLPKGVDSQGNIRQQTEILDDNTMIGLQEEHTVKHVTKEADESLNVEPDLEKAAAEYTIIDDISVIDLKEEYTDAPAIEDEADECLITEPDFEKVTDECTITQEGKGLAISLRPVDYDSLPVVVVPTVQTDAATDVGTDSVILHGSINKTSCEYCDQRKFQIRAQGSESWTDAGSETGSFGPEAFSFTITGLIPDATYEFKAMAHNLAGWGEGSVTTFTAATSPETPAEVTTAKVESSRQKPRREVLPRKTQYDMYRSTYWPWLDSKKRDSSKNPQR